jgi:alkylated DNA repair dioxygenase AlkB
MLHLKQFFKSETANLFTLREQIQWKPRIVFPRSTFRYPCDISSTKIEVESVMPALIEIALHCVNTFNVEVKGIFVNLYGSGEDYTPYHKDSYGNAKTITYSFGATRRFLMKPDDGTKTKAFDLEDGDVFVFTMDDNEKHKHSIPKTTRDGERISVVLFCDTHV